MSDRLSLSAVITTYNRATLVPRAIASALASTGPDDEVIVVDDGSTDDTESALARFRDRIRYIRVPNGGAGRARNIGIAAATRDLVAMLDSDDEWMPDKIYLQRAVMAARPEVVFAFSDFVVREEDGREIRWYLINWHHDTRDWTEILGPGVPLSTLAALPQGREDFLVHIGDSLRVQMTALYILTSSLMVRRVVAGNALRFAEDLVIYEDWECFGRLAAIGAAAYLAAETVWNHGHPGARVSDAAALERAAARVALLQRVWGTNAVFQATHGDDYEAVLRGERVTLVKELLAAGRVAEARSELRQVTDQPLLYRALAALPGGMTRGMLRLRQVMR